MTTLAEQAYTAEEQRLEAAKETYRQLLTRNDAPKKGDAALLDETLHMLGKSYDDFMSDLVTRAEIEYLESLVEEREERYRCARAAEKAKLDFLDEHDRIMRECEERRGKLIVESDYARIAHREVLEGEHRLKRLKAERADLFDPESLPGPPPPQPKSPPEPVAKAATILVDLVEGAVRGGMNIKQPGVQLAPYFEPAKLDKELAEAVERADFDPRCFNAEVVEAFGRLNRRQHDAALAYARTLLVERGTSEEAFSKNGSPTASGREVSHDELEDS